MDEIEIDEVEQRMGGVRRTFTLRSGAARQVAVNFMPSRQLPYSTLRVRRSISEHNALLEDLVDAPDSTDQQANIIVREMEQHQQLMEDNPLSEELRREALRDLPQGLTMKRHVRAKLSASVSLRSKRRPISLWKRLKYRISFSFKKFRDRVRNFVFSVELWYEAIRNIEGHFGSAVGSYFYFLRYLFVMNLLLTIVVLSFVVVPQILHDQTQNSTVVERSVMDFIRGKGSLEVSLMFYGHYHDGDISTHGPFTYNMPFAYFFTMVSVYLVSFGVLCYKTAYSYRRNFIETGGGLSHLYANKVFCGWDFGVVSPRAAQLNAYSIYNEFKELLNEQNKKQVTLTFWMKLGRLATNVLVTVILLTVIAGLEYGFWQLLVLETKTSHWEILVSMVVTLMVTVCPLLFSLVVKLEYYSARTRVYVTLARTWLLHVGTLMLLFVYWAHSGSECWETSFGQETYRLVLFDAFVSLFLLPVIEFVRAFVHKRWKCVGAPEFSVAQHSLTLVYSVGAAGAGGAFSPLLPAALAAKLLLLFYCRRLCVHSACTPAAKIWRAAQTQTVLYMLVTLSQFTTIFVIGSVFFRMSSKQCGPLRGYEHVYEVVSEGLLGLERHTAARAVLHFLTRPGVIAFLLLFLCVAVYYMRARARSQRSMVGILRRMLLLQAKDKDFLLAAIAKVSNGEWLYSPKPEEEGADTHTLKYLNEVRKPSNAGFHFDASRINHSLVDRPRSYAKDNRPNSYFAERRNSQEDGDTDSSFSWQGSSSYLNQKGLDESGDKKLI